jgi:polyhydroxyalkanoate synthase subunit PhaC
VTDDSSALSVLRREFERGPSRVTNTLKLLGQRPEVGASPKTTVWSDGKVELWRYDSDVRRHATPVVFVSSLVSRSYILDLLPDRSFLGFMRDAGFDVYLLEWGVPDASDSGNRLEDYVDRWVPAAVRQACEVSGAEQVSLVGYCLGGVLTGLAAAAHPDLPVRDLVMLAAPLDFSRLGTWSDLFVAGLDGRALLDLTGNVPPLLIENYFRMLKPAAEAMQYASLVQHLHDEDFVRNYQAMNHWIRDHVPFPGAAFQQLVTELLRGNALVRGGVHLGDRVVDVATIDRPLLNVMAEADHLVPPSSAAGWTQVVASTDTHELRRKAGHVGLICGKSSTRTTQPQVAAWLTRDQVEVEP